MLTKQHLFFFLLVLGICISAQIKIAIIGTNDIHGTAFPAQMIRADTEQKYYYGGLQYMGRLIQIIQKQNDGNVLYLDAGDQFQGGIQSSKLVSSGKIMNDFYDSVDLDGSAIGNHQFDFGPNFLFPFMSSKEAPNLAANIRSERNQDVFLPNQEISHLYEFTSGIRIGVIGLSTIQTPSTTAAFSSGLFPAYKFLEYLQIVQDESKKLKAKGAHAVLLVTHIGDECPFNLTYGIWTAQTQQNSCQIGDEMSKLLDTLPNGTVDGVLQGHRHVIAHHFRKGIPYMGSINGGYYFNVMYLTFNDRKQVVNRTIEGPIPVCQRIFTNTGRCNYLTKTQLAQAGTLVPWRFHNQQVYAHPKIKAIFEQEWAPKMNPYIQDLVENELLLKISFEQQNALANMIGALFSMSTPSAEFVILNPGGFRTQWLPGIIQYQHFYNMFPFDNIIKTFDMTGKQLIDTLTILQNGDKGFYFTNGIMQNLTYNVTSDKTGFIGAKWTNGSQIQPTKTYRGLSIDFLLSGGDDFNKVIGKVYTPRNVRNQGDLKQLLKPQIKKLGKINDGVWLDPKNPRIIINKVK